MASIYLNRSYILPKTHKIKPKFIEYSHEQDKPWADSIK